MNSPAVSFLVQAEAPKGEKSSDFREMETMLTFFCRGSPWSFLIFDQLPCFLYDMRYPDSAGCTKNEEEPIHLRSMWSKCLSFANIVASNSFEGLISKLQRSATIPHPAGCAISAPGPSAREFIF